MLDDFLRPRESAQTGNKDVSRQVEAAHRVRLAKGKAGIEKRQRHAGRIRPAFCISHRDTMRREPDTVHFYKEKLRRLLEDRQLSGLRLVAINEAEIDSYKQRRTRQASRSGMAGRFPPSVNRELATLRRLLRLAQDWK